MRHIVEVLGETVTELAGAAAVFLGLNAALMFIRSFADTFISHFI